ncbi:tripartite tricarboxylate transporter substrate-binding protein [Paradesulfitobacterium aromaticivorans]
MMRKQLRNVSKILSLSLIFLLLLVGCATKQTQSGVAKETPSTNTAVKADYEFYNGKTVTFIVATKAGGGYDTYARFVAPYLQKYLPGSTVIVKNVPGAGHVIGANDIYTAKPDGLTIGTFDKGLIITQLVGQEGVKFDLNKFTWLGNATSEPRVFIVGANSPFKSVEDMKKDKAIKLGGTGPGSSSTNDALILSNILGLNMKLINGYGGQEQDLAMMRGEIDGQIGAYSSMQTMLDNKEAIAVLSIGMKLGTIPNLRDLAPVDKKPLVDLEESQAQLSRLMATTPGIPEGRVVALREAIQKAFTDPELLAKADKAKLPIDFMNGEETGKLVSSALTQTPEIKKLIKDITSTK